MKLLNSLPKQKVCAEVGVFRGDFSAEILARTMPQQLYLVDIFTGRMRTGDRPNEPMVWIDMEKEMANVSARFAENRVTVIRDVSWDWLNSLPAGFLDWCYLDTSHVLEPTRRELAGMMHAVKPGGIICGHDYNCTIFPGVVQAVNEVCEREGIDLEIWNAEVCASFRFVRP